MAIVRALLGSLILFFDWIFTPKGRKRDAEVQARMDEITADLTLYHYKACPFCVKVRRAMKRESLFIATRDVKRSKSAKRELLAGGGQLKVPCLRIKDAQGEVSWMYESGDIIGYLNGKLVAGS